MTIVQAKTIAVRKIDATTTAIDDFARKAKDSPWTPRIFVGVITLEGGVLFFACTLIQSNFLRGTTAVGITLLIATTLQLGKKFYKDL